uniref:Uncharacterized protein n=1 Tax=Bos indicus x Bos taurus TaxID=30522 RepID=A0A4W2IHH6_BOBOX
MSDLAVADTWSLNLKLQELTNAYRLPSNFLDINIFNPQTVGVGCTQRTTVLIVPPLPGKVLKWQLPFRGNERVFEDLLAELLINWMDAGHPPAQNERCLHMFLQEEATDRNCVPRKVCP